MSLIVRAGACYVAYELYTLFEPIAESVYFVSIVIICTIVIIGIVTVTITIGF